MKKMTENFKNFLFVIVLLFISSNIFANNSKPSLKILNSEKKVVTITLDNAKSTSVTIRIFDKQGINLLREEVAISNRHSKAYNLSELPKGTYEVEIESHTLIRNYIVTTSSNNLTVIETEEKEIFKPVVKSDGKFILFNMLNLNKEDVVITINNNLGDEVYNERIENTSAIHKSFNLSKLPSGRYSVVIETQAKVFYVEANLK